MEPFSFQHTDGTCSDTLSKVPTMDTYLADIKAKNAAGASPPIMGAFVVYDLPNRDCAALASNGEYSVANNGLANYYNYIDSISTIIQKYPDVSIALVIGKLLQSSSYHNPPLTSSRRARQSWQPRHQP